MYRHFIVPLLIVILVSPISYSYSQENNAELVFQKTSISVNNGILTKSHVYDIRINNRAGEKYTRVSIPYTNMDQISDIDGYLTDFKGEVIKKLKKNDITDKSAVSRTSFYTDDYIKEFTLKHNNYPYYIHYSYLEKQKEFLYLDYWLPILDPAIPTLEAELNVEIPKGYKIFFRNRYTDSCRIDSASSTNKITWSASYPGEIKREPYSPPLIDFLPAVVIVPEFYKYEINGSFDSWMEYGNWQYNLNKNLSDLPLSEISQLHTLTRGTTDEREKINIIYRYLQDETRYINVSLETGGLKPFPASYVAKNKYGDCKALTNYLKSALEILNIPSFYTKVYAGGTIRSIDKTFPSQQFNHVILCVPLEKDTIWLDCTSDGPFNYLGTFTQNREVLIIDRDQSHFTRTPALSREDVLETRNITITQTRQDFVEGTFNQTFRGENFEDLFDLDHNYNETEKESIIREYLIETGFEVTGFSLNLVHRDSAKINLTYRAGSGKVYNRYGNDILIHIFPFTFPRFEDPETRKLPVQIDYPIYLIDTLEYIIPDGFSLSGKIENQVISNESGQYTIEASEVGGVIKIVKSFSLYPGKYSGEKYQILHEFTEKVEQSEDNMIMVVSKE